MTQIASFSVRQRRPKDACDCSSSSSSSRWGLVTVSSRTRSRMRSVPLGSNSRLAIGACVLVAVWSSGIYCTYRSHVVVDVDDAVDVEHRNDGLQQRQRQHEIDSLLSPEAYPVYGTHIELEWNGNKNKQKNNKHNNDNKHNKISVVYAIPSHSSPGGTLSIRRSAIDASTNTTSSQLQSQLQSQSQPGVQALQTRGIVVLLHACTHNALKFFSPSPDGCPSCVGLSEELRIARIVLERGYVALAVTSGSGGGCWGGTTDSMRIQHAVNEFLRRHQSTVLATSTSTATTTTTTLMRCVNNHHKLHRHRCSCGEPLI
mmetsp:Transcript_13835/g.29079  ORF Transcript_13835/g.29079 Transcript_13835/m.29079 type:complete len:316 (-) Transcript_13835:301-1248(-)